MEAQSGYVTCPETHSMEEVKTTFTPGWARWPASRTQKVCTRSGFTAVGRAGPTPAERKGVGQDSHRPEIAFAFGAGSGDRYRPISGPRAAPSQVPLQIQSPVRCPGPCMRETQPKEMTRGCQAPQARGAEGAFECYLCTSETQPGQACLPRCPPHLEPGNHFVNIETWPLSWEIK